MTEWKEKRLWDSFWWKISTVSLSNTYMHTNVRKIVFGFHDMKVVVCVVEKTNCTNKDSFGRKGDFPPSHQVKQIHMLHNAAELLQRKYWHKCLRNTIYCIATSIAGYKRTRTFQFHNSNCYIQFWESFTFNMNEIFFDFTFKEHWCIRQKQ